MTKYLSEPRLPSDYLPEVYCEIHEPEELAILIDRLSEEATRLVESLSNLHPLSISVAAHTYATLGGDDAYQFDHLRLKVYACGEASLYSSKDYDGAICEFGHDDELFFTSAQLRDPKWSSSKPSGTAI